MIILKKKQELQLRSSWELRYNKRMKINIPHIAKLANLPLNAQEIKNIEPQLISTLAYIDQLNEVNTQDIEPTSQVTGMENVLREDIPSESLTQEKVLSNTKAVTKGFFRVKGVFENE
jgi:aspartyl-tRNA(Asn)/glutamyl-tRNA(Gln) amidotransferase subunit C